MDLIPRAQWGARPYRRPNGAIRYAGKPIGVKVHYLGAPYAHRAHGQCAAFIRGVQAQHMDGNGWSDVGYSFLVCGHGSVYEGRGLRRRNSANGSTALNEAHFAVCALLGTSGMTVPTEVQTQGLRDAIAYCRRGGGAGREILGHRDGYPTNCPGLSLYQLVRGGRLEPVADTQYTVRGGDFLSSIAKKYPGVSWQDIAAANHIPAPYTIYPGQRLWIPEARTCTVRDGDTLSAIATRYAGVSWQQIATANHIRSPYVIHPGDVLVIPGASS